MNCEHCSKIKSDLNENNNFSELHDSKNLCNYCQYCNYLKIWQSCSCNVNLNKCTCNSSECQMQNCENRAEKSYKYCGVCISIKQIFDER